MLTKNELKYYSSLLKKKFREEENKFIAEGRKIVSEGLKGNFECEIIIATNEFLEQEKLFFEGLNKSIRTEIVSNLEFHKLKDTVTPQGIAAVFKKPRGVQNEIVGRKDGIICLMDDISDPGNLGTIIRNCDWFGISDILLTKNCAELYSPKVIRASMGSLFHLRCSEGLNRSRMEKLKKEGFTIISSDLDGENLFNYRPEGKVVIVFSNEANGPTKDIQELADKRITIPSFGNAESLNVASASAVILSHLAKVRTAGS